MLESIKQGGFSYKKLSPEEMKSRRILGRLIGPCADFNECTRNERLYSEELWENVFNDPIMLERIENGVCFGELGHPADREETDPARVAVVMPEPPKKDTNGSLIALFDILDTPMGQILKTFCDYGSVPGISSRGNGDLIRGRNGQEEVDPRTYRCEGFDVVLIPSVKKARLKYVTESLNTSGKTLKESLESLVSAADSAAKPLMEETINNLFSASEKDDEINNSETLTESVDDVKNSLVKDLQTALNEKQTYKTKLDAVTESLSVSYAKGVELEDENKKLKESIESLKESKKLAIGRGIRVARLTAENSEMQEALEESMSQIKKLGALNKIGNLTEGRLQEAVKNYTSVNNKLSESLKGTSEKLKSAESLNEELSKKVTVLSDKNAKTSAALKEANGKLKATEDQLNEQIDLNLRAHSRITELKEITSSLKEQLEASSAKDEIEAYKTKLDEAYAANKTTESQLKEALETIKAYEKKLNTVSTEYGKIMAQRYSVDYDEISNKIMNKTPEEVRNLCESLSENKMRLASNLPFSNVTKITYSKPYSPVEKKKAEDGQVDDDLCSLFERFNQSHR